MLLKMEAGLEAVVQVDRYEYDMPPGFRFHPTDEEIITYYLLNKVMDTRFASFAMGEVDLNTSEPWDLPRKAKMGENEWFFFCEKDRKYQRGMRTNRATKSGYWKATGKDREIFSSKKKRWLVGMKKTLVFYTGRAPKGERTNWIMHEYRLHGNFPNHNISTTAKEKWVVCKVFHKKIGSKTSTTSLARPALDSFVDNLLELPPFRDCSISTDQNPTTSGFATEEDDHEVKPDFSSSNYQLQMLHHNQNNFIAPPPLIISSYNQYCSPHYLNPNPICNPQNFHPDSFIPYQPPSLVHHKNIYPDSRTDLEAEAMCKMEDYTLNDSIVSHSQDTGVLSNEMATEISSVQYCKGETESKKATDREFEGVPFSPNIVDLDYLWSY